ncbi:hypothetical protein DL96DRAFT_1607581 [Flagelloscypha sp. PMI_526]|nr:hypothetical protein DL96DRAFT_1607581 [Flagelloscypha sp. PMI_526]
MPLPYNPDSPYFPQELEELIFTLSARTAIGKDLVSLRLVCRRAKTWTEPFRFRVLSLTRFKAERQPQEHRDLLFSLPEEVLSSSVQRIWVGTWLPDDFRILSRCRGITHLALTEGEQKVPALYHYANLQRLTLVQDTADRLFRKMRRRSEHQCPSITHIQIFGYLIREVEEHWIWNFRDAFSQLPALSHFMLEDVSYLDDFDRSCLQSVANLNQMKMMVILKSPVSLAGDIDHVPLDHYFADNSKVVVLNWESGSMRQEWDNSCIEKADAWDEAEDIMKKRAEEA